MFGHDVQTVTDNLTFYTSTIERNGGNKSEWIDRLSEPADGKNVGISAWHRFVAGRNPDVDMVGRVGRKYD